MFDKNYIKWKGWSGSSLDESFGKYSKYENDYFKSVLKLVGVQKENNLLEIGFGNGNFLNFCKENNYKVSGSELNPLLLNIASELDFTVFDGFGSSSEKELFDFIFAFDVFEHIPHSGAVDFLNNCKALLKTNGKLILRFPNGDSPFSLSIFNADPTHMNWIGSDKIQYYSAVTEFSNCRTYGNIEVILTSSLKHAILNSIIIPIKFLINFAYKYLFYPSRKI